MQKLEVGQVGEVAALTTTKGQEPFVFEGELMAWSSKRTDGRLGDTSPIAILRLYKNVSERVKPSRRFVLAFEKVEADGSLITASYRSYTSLQKMAEKSPADKMHRRICELVGVRGYMADIPQDVGGE